MYEKKKIYKIFTVLSIWTNIQIENKLQNVIPQKMDMNKDVIIRFKGLNFPLIN